MVYGTSQHLTRLKTGDVAITKAKYPAAFALAGLAYDTKFDFKVIVDLPWSDRYFKVPVRNPHVNTPKMGTLHATVLAQLKQHTVQQHLARLTCSPFNFETNSSIPHSNINEKIKT